MKFNIIPSIMASNVKILIKLLNLKLRQLLIKKCVFQLIAPMKEFEQQQYYKEVNLNCKDISKYQKILIIVKLN